MTQAPTLSQALVGDPNALAIILKPHPSNALVATALGLLVAREKAGLDTVIVSDTVPEEVKLAPEWSRVVDGFNPLEYPNILGLGIENLTQSGLFEATPTFADWPQREMFIKYEHDFEYIEEARKAIESRITLTPAAATGLLLAIHLAYPEVVFIPPTPLYAELLKKGANQHKIFFFLNLSKPPMLWWQALLKGHIEGGLLEAVLPKKSLDGFLIGRVEVLELAQALKDKDLKWNFKFRENSESVFLELSYKII